MVSQIGCLHEAKQRELCRLAGSTDARCERFISLDENSSVVPNTFAQHWTISCGAACGTAPRNESSTRGSGHLTKAASPGTGRPTSNDTMHTQTSAFRELFQVSH
ncbi:unnamed protein product [Chrysodeixis includens]|uniref:Uncharacterized protein n=1 Tax=Chrysodeixis includens TaxID=689277 RepID=A0A9P0FSX2_CHRIL|nr:unnamed protein product [Chrysodeixis includens]